MRSGTKFRQFLGSFLPTLGTKLYRQIVGIPMGTIVPLLFYFTVEGILRPLFLIIKKLKLFKHLNQYLDI